MLKPLECLVRAASQLAIAVHYSSVNTSPSRMRSLLLSCDRNNQLHGLPLTSSLLLMAHSELVPGQASELCLKGGLAKPGNVTGFGSSYGRKRNMPSPSNCYNSMLELLGGATLLLLHWYRLRHRCRRHHCRWQASKGRSRRRLRTLVGEA